ncbi:hypothetical protein, partial [Bacillus mycoides]
MTTTLALTLTADRNLDATLATVAAEVGRTDGKASLLLAFDGAALAGIASLADKPLPLATKIIGGLAAVALAGAAALLLLVVRPRIGGPNHTSARGSFLHLARLS